MIQSLVMNCHLAIIQDLVMNQCSAVTFRSDHDMLGSCHDLVMYFTAKNKSWHCHIIMKKLYIKDKITSVHVVIICNKLKVNYFKHCTTNNHNINCDIY